MLRLFLIFLFIPGLLFSQQILSSLETDFKENKLSYEEYLVNKVLAIHQPGRLAEKYAIQQSGPIKSGTFIVAEAKANWDIFSEENKKLLKPLLDRPVDLPEIMVSPSGQFRIHYTVDENNVDKVELTDEDQNGVPDYIDHVAVSFDHCHSFLTDTLGYRSPLSDNGKGGGDEYDIYIVEYGGSVYGETVFEDEVSQYKYSSFVIIDNDYAGYYSKGLNGLRVTAAHEYFHAIQYAYKFRLEDTDFWRDEVFYFEVSSVWMEDVIYDEINDYYNYLSGFFYNIDQPFNSRNGNYEYGNTLWNHMLVRKYGRDIVRKIWVDFEYNSVLNSINNILTQYQSDFNAELSDYTVWNFFTGSRSDSINYYPEGSHYPEARFEKTIQFTSDTEISDRLNSLSYAYYHIQDTENGNNITLIPANFIQDRSQLLDFTYEITRSQKNDAKKVANDFYVNLVVSNPAIWATRTIIVDAYGNIIVDGIVNDPISGFGPNPFIVSKHDYFNLYYHLEKRSPVTISIFTENGLKVKEVKYLMMEDIPHLFQLSRSDVLSEQMRSGIYLLLLKTEYSKELIKFAIIR